MEVHSTRFQNRRFLISHHDVAASGIAAPTSILLPNPGYTAMPFGRHACG
jgi:hypothetical protein